MTLPTAFTLATDAQFRELSNFITPPRAGRVTALEGNGQVRVATDDPDGGDVLAWPLNGFAYAVDDVVYISFAVNNPESALVIGSKGATPTLDAYIRRSGDDELTGDWDIGEDRAIALETLQEALTSAGIVVQDDAGNVGLAVLDGGHYVVVGDDESAEGYSGFDAEGNVVLHLRYPTSHANAPIAGSEKRIGMVYVRNDGATNKGKMIYRVFDAGIARDVLTMYSSGYTELLSRLGIGTSPSAGLHLVTTDGGVAVIIDASGTAYNATSGLARFIDDTDREIVIGGLGMFRRDVDADNGDLRFNFLGYNGGATRYRDFKVYDGKGNLIFVVDGSEAAIGIGQSAPQGTIHADGFMYEKKTSIDGTKQVIIANGTGDVTQILTGFFTLSDGSSGVSNAISMTPAPSTFPIAVGGSTWTLTLATNGEFSVQRTSGSGTATMTFMLTWI